MKKKRKAVETIIVALKAGTPLASLLTGALVVGGCGRQASLNVPKARETKVELPSKPVEPVETNDEPIVQGLLRSYPSDGKIDIEI